MTKLLFIEIANALFCFNSAPLGNWFETICNLSAQLAHWTGPNILHCFPVLILCFLTASQ